MCPGNHAGLDAVIRAHNERDVAELSNNVRVLQADGALGLCSMADVAPDDVPRVSVDAGVDLDAPVSQLAVSVDGPDVVGPGAQKPSTSTRDLTDPLEHRFWVVLLHETPRHHARNRDLELLLEKYRQHLLRQPGDQNVGAWVASQGLTESLEVVVGLRPLVSA